MTQATITLMSETYRIWRMKTLIHHPPRRRRIARPPET